MLISLLDAVKQSPIDKRSNSASSQHHQESAKFFGFRHLYLQVVGQHLAALVLNSLLMHKKFH